MKRKQRNTKETTLNNVIDILNDKIGKRLASVEYDEAYIETLEEKLAEMFVDVKYNKRAVKLLNGAIKKLTQII